MLESAKRDHPRLTIREIIFEIKLCDHDISTLRTDTIDGQTACRDNTALCVASRGKKQIGALVHKICSCTSVLLFL